MPRVIQRALVEKFADSTEWKTFRDDFEAATGFRLEVVDEFGRNAREHPPCHAGFCQLLKEASRGAEACTKFRQSILAKASAAPVCGTCAAGLTEVAVPLRVGAVTAGYLVFGGFHAAPPGNKEWDRVSRFLKDQGIRGTPLKWKAAWESATELPHQKARAYTRFVELAVRIFSERMTLHLASTDRGLPEPVKKACRFLRRECLLRDVSLGEIARHVGMSEGHFSRTFHHSTGLTFGEYVARHRVDRTRELLRDPRIRVTDAAFASGFQSISQFHRVFRKIVGVSPVEFRRQIGAP
jgi:AraC-like DNA-binding protein